MQTLNRILILSLIYATSCCVYSAEANLNMVSITVDPDYRYISSNGVPKVHGSFPNLQNQNSIEAQNYYFRTPLQPQFKAQFKLWQEGQTFGVAIDGVPIDPGAAKYWNGDQQWRYEVIPRKAMLGFDQNNADVDQHGAYRYHGIPTALLAVTKQHSPLIGYAADGLPIYAQYGYSDANNPKSPIKELTTSYKLRTGERGSGPGGNYDGTFSQDYVFIAKVGNPDLDACNGRYGPTPDYPKGTYYYFLTATFPFVPRCFKGIPDASFRNAPALNQYNVDNHHKH